MTLVGWAQIALVLALVLACAIPLSKFIADVYAGERTFLSPVVGPVERGFYRLAGVDPAREQDWFVYTTGDAGVLPRRLPGSLRGAEAPGPAAVEPARLRCA